jgi:hypothetical protein
MAPMLWIAMWLAGVTPLQASSEQTQIRFTVAGYRGDGTASMEVSTSGGKQMWVDPMHCSGSSAPMSSSTSVSWEFSGQIVQQNGDSFQVEVYVHRSGQEPMPPRTITIGLDKRVVIDELTGIAGSCWSVVRFEVGVTRALGVQSGVPGGVTSGVGAGRAAGVSGGVSNVPTSGVAAGVGGGISAGGRAGARPGSPGSTAAMFATSMGMAETGRVTVNGVLTDHSVPMHPIDSAAYNAQVWLVYKPLNGPEETWSQTGHIARDGRVFEFSTIPVETDHGLVQVDIAAMLRPMTLDDGSVVLRAAIARLLSGAGNSVGSSATAIPMPAATDVVSFETPAFPAGRVKFPDPLAGHQFSVRVRIAPGK